MNRKGPFSDAAISVGLLSREWHRIFRYTRRLNPFALAVLGSVSRFALPPGSMKACVHRTLSQSDCIRFPHSRYATIVALYSLRSSFTRQLFQTLRYLLRSCNCPALWLGNCVLRYSTFAHPSAGTRVYSTSAPLLRVSHRMRPAYSPPIRQLLIGLEFFATKHYANLSMLTHIGFGDNTKLVFGYDLTARASLQRRFWGDRCLGELRYGFWHSDSCIGRQLS